jgi:DNA-binding NarL/FixJ family response regulator
MSRALELAREQVAVHRQQLHEAMMRVAWLEMQEELQEDPTALPPGLEIVQEDVFYDSPSQPPVRATEAHAFTGESDAMAAVAQENKRAATTELPDMPESTAEPEPEPVPEPAARKSRSGLTEEKVRAAHAACDTQAAIARELGVCDATAKYWLDKLGLVPRKRGRKAGAVAAVTAVTAEPAAQKKAQDKPELVKSFQDEVAELVAQGMDDPAIADRLGFSTRQVRKWRLAAQEEDIKALSQEKKPQESGHAAWMRNRKRQANEAQLQEFTEEVVEEDGVKITRLKPGYAFGTTPAKNVGFKN